jgi:hypothetical protein
VKAGDWIKYESYQTRNWGLENRESVKVQFLNVSGVIVSGDVVVHYFKGSEETVTFSGNISEGLRIHFGTGEPHPYDVSCLLPQNTTAGDAVFMYLIRDFSASLADSVFFDFSFNYSSTVCDFNGVTREVNLASRSYKAPAWDDIAEFGEKYVWDKATGVLLKADFTQRMFYLKYNTTSLAEGIMQVAETSLWETPHSPTTQLPKFFVLGSLLTVLGLVPVIVRSKAKRATKRTS